MYLNKQDVLDTAASKDPTTLQLRQQIQASIGGSASTPVTEKQIDSWLDRAKSRQEAHNLGKGTRPWFLLDLTGKLDPEQPWVGVEYETGYGSRNNYLRVQNWLWKNIDNMTMDGEGCGEYPVEITFPPQNYNQFVSNDFFMDSLLVFLNESKISQDRGPARYNDGEDDYEDYAGPTGIHVNMSTPKYRALDGRARQEIVYFLTRSIERMNYKEKTALFNREPYGYFESRGGYKEGDVWIEGKLFDTTDSPEVWAKYKDIIGRLIGLIDPAIDAFQQVPNKKGQYGSVSAWKWNVEGLFDYLSGKTDSAKFVQT